MAHNSTESRVLFTAVYESNASKMAEVLLSLVNIFAVTPFMYLIIWYERYGANHNRTLVNQFATSGANPINTRSAQSTRPH
jgi:hypothetical protein